MDGSMPVSVKATNHWAFNAYEARFQEYAEHYTEGQKEAPLIPIETIDKVPLSFLIGARDHTCPKDQAKANGAIIGADVDFWYEIKGKTHLELSGIRN